MFSQRMLIASPYPLRKHPSGYLSLSLCLALAVTGCSSGSSKSAMEPTADFSLSTSVSTISVVAGTGGSITLTDAAMNGFNSAVTVAISGLPAGVTVSPFSPVLTPGMPQTITMTASTGAAVGPAAVTFTGTAGALTHAAMVTLSVTAAPDYSLSLSLTTLTLTTGTLGQQISVSATGNNGFNGTVSVSLSGLPAEVTATPSTLTLALGMPQTILFTAAADASVGTFNISVNGQSGMQSGNIAHSVNLALTIAAPTGIDATTYHYDNARTGLNPNETILTPANVGSASFGRLNFLPVDGLVDGEPLYLSGVTIKGQTHNVLYVVTEHASIYAFDADSGAQLWTTSALGAGETTSDDHHCSQITPEIGITSTPVIDRRKGANGTIFTVAMSKDAAGAYHQRLHALDITTGLEIAGSPTEITGTYPGTGDNSSNGRVIFDPGQYAERVGLLLMNQTLYLGWTSHCDFQPYTGWVMAYSENTLLQTQILNLTPNGNEGAVWMSGAGLAADTAGNIFLLDANGTLDTTFDTNGFPASFDYGNAIIRLSTTGGGLSVADYFEPYNTYEESDQDIDLGSGGVLLLPDLTDVNGNVRHLLVGAGKDTNIYIGDRDNLGKFNPTDNSNLYQELEGALYMGAWSMPAYFNNTIYYAGVSDVLRAYPITNARLASKPSSTSSTTFGYPGATPSISSNGNTNGIVWALESTLGSPAVLHAYDATNLANELYNSKQAANGRDSFGNGNKFITPMIVNGKVYVGTPNGVAVFGLLH